ncbi:hypothetical protein [Nocardiopsis valliformis]|uniref:hypothetical protein n=1 Tax=Nocardiopsis valliformis TaxID=239974 RepID=UPI000684F318|nr:hypothetical protein [Nocardiopsis valliformis]
MEAPTRTPALSRPAVTPSVVGGAVMLVIGVSLTLSAWDSVVPDPARHQIFLSLWLVGAALLAARLFLNGLPGSPLYVPRGAMTFGIGVVAAAAVATMPWSDLGSVFWYQLWLSVPLLTGLAVAAFHPSAYRHSPDHGQHHGQEPGHTAFRH